RPYRSAVQKNPIIAMPDLPERVDNRLRGIRRSGKDFEQPQPATFHPDAIGKGAASVDGNAQRGNSQRRRTHGLLAVSSSAPMRLNSRSSAALLNHLPE